MRDRDNGIIFCMYIFHQKKKKLCYFNSYLHEFVLGLAHFQK